VRFLNEVGGGTITGFKGKDMVLVSDADGFEVPVLAKDVVVVETDSYNIAKKPSKFQKNGSLKENNGTDNVKEPPQEEEKDLAELLVTFRPRAEERRGADQLSLYLAFLPVDIKNVTDTSFEAYLVNDCNYYFHYSLLTHSGNACHLRHEGEVAPNTKVFLEEFRRDVLDDLRRITIQATAYKREKSFLLKPTLNIGLRIDGTKFYKLHTFQPSLFFNEPSLVYDIVVNDCPARTVLVDAAELQEAMTTPSAPVKKQPARAMGKGQKNTQGNDPHAILEVDLHATELLDTMVGMQPKDILDYQLKVFRDTMNTHIKERGRRIVFIHGKGEGVLRQALLGELKARFPRCTCQDASFKMYGFGATMVTVRG